jgi:sulfite exporter TauE/SafE/copper chaperone CopZ
MKETTLYVKGMHCASCTVLVEEAVKDHPKITWAKASLGSMTLNVKGDFTDKETAKIANELSQLVKKHGYEISHEKQKTKVSLTDFKIAIPIALIFVTLYILLQKAGFLNVINSSEIKFGSAFVIGLVASISTCMAVVGGLVLSISANAAKSGSKVLPQIIFHASRLISFFVLGGILGLLGSAFDIGKYSSYLNLIIAFLLIILGLNLLDIFPWTARLIPTLPKNFGTKLQSLKHLTGMISPVLLGAATFILPCGFTQSMQIYALSTGSFSEASMLMLAFALGTLPVLAILSFTSFGLANKGYSGIFFKTVGLIVVFFGLLNLYSSLVLLQLIRPFINF